MPSETHEIIELPRGFSYGRFVEPFSLSTEFIVDKSIGKVYECANSSLPRAHLDALYCLGRDLEWNLADPEVIAQIPAEAQELGRFVFRRMQEKQGEGAFHPDYVRFEPGMNVVRDPVYGMIKRPEKGYTAGWLFHDAIGFERGGRFDVKEAKERVLLWFPPEGWIVPGTTYILNRRFGIPDATEKNESKARRKIAQAYEISDDQAAALMSNFCWVNDGWAVVGSWSGHGHGPESVEIIETPLNDYWNAQTGRLAASRSQQTSGYRLTTDEEAKAS